MKIPLVFLLIYMAFKKAIRLHKSPLIALKIKY